jgi:hypothetical protein
MWFSSSNGQYFPLVNEAALAKQHTSIDSADLKHACAILTHKTLFRAAAKVVFDEAWDVSVRRAFGCDEQEDAVNGAVQLHAREVTKIRGMLGEAKILILKQLCGVDVRPVSVHAARREE